MYTAPLEKNNVRGTSLNGRFLLQLLNCSVLGSVRKNLRARRTARRSQKGRSRSPRQANLA